MQGGFLLWAFTGAMTATVLLEYFKGKVPESRIGDLSDWQWRALVIWGSMFIVEARDHIGGMAGVLTISIVLAIGAVPIAIFRRRRERQR